MMVSIVIMVLYIVNKIFLSFIKKDGIYVVRCMEWFIIYFFVYDKMIIKYKLLKYYKI